MPTSEMFQRKTALLPANLRRRPTISWVAVKINECGILCVEIDVGGEERGYSGKVTLDFRKDILPHLLAMQEAAFRAVKAEGVRQAEDETLRVLKIIDVPIEKYTSTKWRLRAEARNSTTGKVHVK